MERRKKRSETGLLYIPPELWSNVLSRVPVKSVMRFRCVCRTWCWLIDEPSFGPLHLNNFTLSHQMNHKSDSSFLFTTHELEQSRFRNKHTFEITDPFPIPNRFCCNAVSDVVNGVVLICINRQLILWNPSLHKYIVMFASFPYSYTEVFGLGYDSMTNDYKVIIVMNERLQSVLSHPPNPPHLTVYSAQAGGLVRWSMGDVPIQSGFNCRVFLHGAIHRLKKFKERPAKGSRHFEAVVAFDTTRETFHYIELPECIVGRHGDGPFSTHLIDFTGYLALCDVQKSEDRIVLWVMETYGESETWAKRYTIYLDFDCFCYLTEDGDILYILSDEVKTLNIRSGKMKNMNESFAHFPCYINCYKESLALYNL